MRRHSPSRSIRNRSPPRKRGPGSLSPISRSQPAPPGEERSRKFNPWNPPDTTREKRYRPNSKPRQRDWTEVNNHTDDALFYGNLEEELDRSGRVKVDSSGKTNKDRSRGDRDRYQPSREGTSGRRQVQKRDSMQTMDFEDGFLNSGGHESGQFVRSDAGRKGRVSPSHKNAKSSKDESASERIKRLEKLVEKLVNPQTAHQGNFLDKHLESDSIPELIPSNSKFTTSMWLDRVHQECLNKNYNEKSTIRFVQDNMTGLMKSWFKSVSSYDFTWPELKLLITKTFPDNLEFAETLKLLVARDKSSGETMTQYYFSKLYLCEACKITGPNAVSCIVAGLSNPFMIQDIRARNFLSPEMLYTEYFLKHPEEEHAVHVKEKDLREVVTKWSYKNDNYVAPPEVTEFDNEQNVPYKKKKCYTCGKYGHVAADCRHAPLCYICKKEGHIAAKCYYGDN